MAHQPSAQHRRPRIRDSILTGGVFPEDTHDERPGESEHERVSA